MINNLLVFKLQQHVNSFLTGYTCALWSTNISRTQCDNFWISNMCSQLFRCYFSLGLREIDQTSGSRGVTFLIGALCTTLEHKAVQKLPLCHRETFERQRWVQTAAGWSSGLLRGFYRDSHRRQTRCRAPPTISCKIWPSEIKTL